MITGMMGVLVEEIELTKGGRWCTTSSRRGRRRKYTTTTSTSGLHDRFPARKIIEYQ